MNYIRHLNGFFERLAEDRRLSSYHISLYIALFQLWNANRFSDQFTISRMEVMQLGRLGSANTYARCIRELADWGYITYQPSSNLHSGSKVTCTRFDIGSDTAGNTAPDTGIKSDTSTYATSNTGRDTGISCDLKGDTGADTTGDIGIESDTASDTTADTVSDTGITASAENDTGRSTEAGKSDPTGIKSDTGTDTASETLLINITNKNKLEEESSKRNSKEKVEENPREKSGERGKTENHPKEKLQIPEFDLITHFFERNQSSADEAQRFYSHYQSSGWKTAEMKTIVSWQAIARKWIENNQNNRTDERESNQVRTGKLSVTVNKNYNEPL
jgi:hypothetical protein